MKKWLALALAFMALAWVSSCGQPPAADQAADLRLKASLFTAANRLNACLREQPPPGAELDDAQLLEYCFRDRPGKLEPFKDYNLRVRRAGGIAVMLVCTPDGEKALMEYAVCTRELYRNYRNATPPQPCEFTMDPARECPAD
jgi:hypothetical protein